MSKAIRDRDFLQQRKRDIQIELGDILDSDESDDIKSKLRRKLIKEMTQIDTDLARHKAAVRERIMNQQNPFWKEFYKVCQSNLSEYLFKDMFNMTKARLDLEGVQFNEKDLKDFK